MVKLKKSFPQLPEGFYDVLTDRLKENGFTDKRLCDAVNNLVDNFVYPTPTIANVISFDKRVKLYDYYQIIEMVSQYGVSVWDNYKPVKTGHKLRLFASIKDIDSFKLEIV